MNKEWMIPEKSADERLSLVENNVIADMMDVYGPENVMVNVGAHRGGHLPAFTKKEWSIYTFEPDANNRAVLQKYFGDKVYVDSRAVSNQIQKQVPFYTSARSSGISSMLEFDISHKQAYQVDVTTVAQFCHEQGVDHIDYLLVDTEGFDLKVLQGVDWNEMQPRYIVCEFDENKTKLLDYDFHTLAGFLINKGYAVYVSEWYPVVEYGQKHQWRGLKKYPCELADVSAWGNFIALSVGIDDSHLVSLFEIEMSRKPNIFKQLLKRVIYRS